MRFFKRSLASILTSALVGATAFTGAGVNAMAQDDNPSEVLLGMFFTSQSDQTDTLYVSFDGTEFEAIGTPFADRNPQSAADNIYKDPFVSYAACLHDPSLQYHNGYFWSMSGFTENGRFRPMLTYSPDLVNWSYPNTGGTTNNTNSSVKLTTAPYGRSGKRDNATAFDVAAPDLFIDDDGTGWIVSCFGYYGDFHGEPQNDKLSPYIIKVSNLQPGTTEVPTTERLRAQMPKCTYSDAVPMNLVGATSDNYIDASLYKENGTYYLSIKRDGIYNEIWKTDNISLSSSWTRVTDGAVLGYEGPALTKFGGKYLMYTDKLADYPYGKADGTTGTFVTESTSLASGWTNTHRISTKTISGTAIPNRHGFVLCVKDPSAIDKIMTRYRASGGVYPVTVTGLSLDKTALVLKRNASYTFNPNVTPANAASKANIKWSSSDDSIASVSQSGVVTAKKAGVVNITATVSDDIKESCRVRVQFDDVTDTNSAFYTPINWAADSKITTGIGNNLFAPDNSCTRGQMVTFLWRLAKQPEPTDTTTDLKDVKSDSAFYKAILWAAENNITTGFADKTFRQDDTCTRGQIVTFLWRYAGNPDAPSGVKPLSDVKASGNVFYNAIMWAIGNKITTGFDDGTFKQDNTCTRGQGVTFLHRYNNIK